MSAPLEDALAAIRGSAGAAEAPPGIALTVATPHRMFAAIDGDRQRAELGRGETLPMTLDTQHDLASVTKVLATTTSIMRLIDSGELSLDRRVRELLSSSGVDPATTVRDLLLHRAGLWEWWPLYLEASDRERAFAVLDRLPLRYPPGSARHYSDLGFMLLGRIVEQVSGLGLAAAVQTLVLDPLGLSSTGYAHPRGDEVAASSRGDEIERRMVDTGVPYPVPFRAEEFGHWRSEVIIGEVNDGNAFHAFGGVSGHAGLFSTVPDLLAFGQAMASDDEAFLSAAVRRQFFAEGPDAGQALGFRRYELSVGEASVPVIGHPGFTGTVIGWVPGEGTAIVLATNRLHVTGPPMPNDQMWAVALEGAGEAIS